MEGETWVNLKGPLVIEEEPVKERGSRTMVGNMITRGFPVLTASNLLLGHRWRTLNGSSMCFLPRPPMPMETPDTNSFAPSASSLARIDIFLS
jgi:hypothetical protein